MYTDALQCTYTHANNKQNPHIYKNVHIVCILCTCKTVIVNINLQSVYLCLQCFDAVGWAAGRASGL